MFNFLQSGGARFLHGELRGDEERLSILGAENREAASAAGVGEGVRSFVNGGSEEQ